MVKVRKEYVGWLASVIRITRVPHVEIKGFRSSKALILALDTGHSRTMVQVVTYGEVNFACVWHHS